MKNKKFIAIIFALAILFSSCASMGEKNKFGIYVHIGAENIQAIEIDFLRGENVVSTTGCSNADNTEIKIGQMFGFDKPDYGNSDFSLQIRVKTVSGDEIESEKTHITLPGGFDRYELELALDDTGEYFIKLLKSERINENG